MNKKSVKRNTNTVRRSGNGKVLLVQFVPLARSGEFGRNTRHLLFQLDQSGTERQKSASYAVPITGIIGRLEE